MREDKLLQTLTETAEVMRQALDVVKEQSASTQEYIDRLSTLEGDFLKRTSEILQKHSENKASKEIKVCVWLTAVNFIIGIVLLASFFYFLAQH